jgi:hypothetical protein
MGWHRHLWHPTTQVATAPEPLRVVSARGSLLQLDDGRQLIDAISSWWVTLHGHGEPSIAAAIAAQAQQLEQVIFANFSHPPAEQLAEKLASLTGLDRLFFSDNGSTAVEVALKIAWQWWRNRGEPRQQLIAFEGAYHGDTVGAMALGERSLFNSAYEGLMFSVARAPWPASWWGDESVEARELQALAVLGALPPGFADDGAHDQRHLDLAAVHVAGLGGDVDELVHAQHQEVHADMHMDRPHAGHGGTDGDTRHRVFRQRRGEDAARAELLEQAARGSLDRLVIVDVETENEHAGIARHLQRHRLGQRIDVAQHWIATHPPAQ